MATSTYEFDRVTPAPHEWEAGEYVPIGNVDAYDGPYEVIPAASAQTLATRNLLMTQDMTVTAVPTYRTTNESGGYTFSIIAS